MEKVLDHHMQSEYHTTLTDNYRFWKYNRDKFQQWVIGRHKQVKLDAWDQYIVRTKLPGTTVVYDGQAVFWKDLGAVIVENWVPKVVEPYVTLLTPELDQQLCNTVSNLVFYRPLSCKLTTSMFDYLSKPIDSRSGKTPCFVDWLTPKCKIYFSLGQEFFAFNRLKRTLLQFVEYEAEKLESQFNLKLILKSYSANDYANGHLKLVFERP